MTISRQFNSIEALIHNWLKAFDTKEEATIFGNAASRELVKEVKLGMTPAEVEAALGLPETKADLMRRCSISTRI